MCSSCALGFLGLISVLEIQIDGEHVIIEWHECQFCFYALSCSMWVDVWTYLISCAGLAGRCPSIHLSVQLACQKLQCWTAHINFSMKFFHTCHACSHHWLFYHLIPHWVTLTLAWGSTTRSSQNRTCWLHFLAHFSTVWYEFDAMMKQFKHLETTFWAIWVSYGSV